MNKSIAISAALATAISLGVSAPAHAEKKEKCYGVALAGQNDCGNIQGTHSCAGQSTMDNDPGEWRLVTAGLCEELGGFDRKMAKAKVKEMEAKAES
jgi:uncharacterized membrane protein